MEFRRFLLLALALPVPLALGGDGCEWIPHDNCVDTNKFACSCRASHPEGPCTPCNPGSSRKKSSPAGQAAAAPAPVATAAAPGPASAPAPATPQSPAAVPPKVSPTDTDSADCTASQGFEFPEPSVQSKQAAMAEEQAWMQKTWPGYNNGVSLGGAFVIEDWMFYRHSNEVSKANLQLAQNTPFDNLAWSEALLQGSLEKAYATMDCHLNQFYSDADLDKFAEFGINSARVVVGYWLFDDPTLYPNDAWMHKPSGSGKYGAYGVNPDGFITPGTQVLSDLVVRLWNRNIKVLIDMHALPGCSSPHQSYAGVHCEPQSPNTWNGQAHDGISGGHKVTRADDGKTWTDVAKKIALERVVPWIKFMNKHAPGAIVGYELVNEPDIASNDATLPEVRGLTVDLGRQVLSCLGGMADNIYIGISTAAKNVPSGKVAHDYLTTYKAYKGKYISDIHHYFYWSGCIDYGAKTFSVECACEANLPGSPRQFEDVDWANWMKSGVFEQGWRFYVGEWSAGSGPAHKCQGGVPTKEQSQSMWKAQKWGYMNQYVHYRGKAGGQSSFLGDFYWNGRMGYNWNPDPEVCAGSSSVTHYTDFKSWDWSLLRLIKLGIAQPLSQLGWTPATVAGKKAESCAGTINVLCDASQAPQAPPGGQPGMAAAPPGGQPGMARLDAEEHGSLGAAATESTWGAWSGLLAAGAGIAALGGAALATQRRLRGPASPGYLLADPAEKPAETAGAQRAETASA